MTHLEPYVRPSRITIPKHCHPMAALVFRLMRDKGVTYDQLEWDAGVLRSTFKAWRTDNRPGLESLQAALGALGWQLVPCPSIETLPDDIRDQLEDIGQHFIQDDHALAAAIVAATSKAGSRAKDGQPAPRLEYRKPYWKDAA